MNFTHSSTTDTTTLARGHRFNAGACRGEEHGGKDEGGRMRMKGHGCRLSIRALLPLFSFASSSFSTRIIRTVPRRRTFCRHRPSHVTRLQRLFSRLPDARHVQFHTARGAVAARGQPGFTRSPSFRREVPVSVIIWWGRVIGSFGASSQRSWQRSWVWSRADRGRGPVCIVVRGGASFGRTLTRRGKGGSRS